jgi:membrane protease YdiL (CAAX protease family)
VSARWYAVALLTAPLLKAATIVGLLVASVEFNPAIVTEDDKVSVLLGGISSGIFVAIFEEIGWTGFAMPRLKLRCSVLTTGLLMGFLWGLWHFPMFAGSTDSSETIPPVLYVALLLFSWLPPYRVLMVWVYDRTGSVLLAMVMHFPIVVMSVVLADDDMPGDVMAISLLAMGALLWLTVGAVALANGRRFLAKPADPTVPARAIGRAGGLPSAS